MNKQIELWLSRRGFLVASGAVLAASIFDPLTSGAADEGREVRVWIYRDFPDGEDSRTPSERYFTPYFFFPESKARSIKANVKKADPDGQGTCIEFTFGLNGADDFAGAGFIPGDRLGDKPAYDVARKLLVGFGRPVYLRFRARAKEGDTVKVRFESCGVSSGDLEDGIRLPQTPRPELTVLKGKWQPITIDLTKKATGLEKVVCPLKVIARANDNPGKDEIIVYVDDVCFEVGDPAPKKDK